MSPAEKKPVSRIIPQLGERMVLVYRERFWRDVASWAAIVLVLAGGLCALGWAYFTDNGAAGPFGWLVSRERRVPPSAETPPQTEVAFARRLIDGQPLEEGTAQDCGYFAVMIDNMVDGRPQAGLAAAPLVWSAPVEAGITRFLAIYPYGAGVKKIGPVRSARPYYLDWTRELDALYTHVGGSPEALKKIRNSDLKEINQFYWGRYFWRDQGRRAPFNVYTSTELLGEYLDQQFKCGCRDCGAWRYKEEADLEERPETPVELSVGAKSPAYAATWKYDRVRNDYRRMQNDAWQKDEDGSQIRAKNIVVEFAKVTILDEVGRRQITTVGEGKALVAKDGLTVEATWKKPAAEERTRFYDATGNEIEFNVGTTWIEVVAEGTEVTY